MDQVGSTPKFKQPCVSPFGRTLDHTSIFEVVGSKSVSCNIFLGLSYTHIVRWCGCPAWRPNGAPKICSFVLSRFIDYLLPPLTHMIWGMLCFGRVMFRNIRRLGSRRITSSTTVWSSSHEYASTIATRFVFRSPFCNTSRVALLLNRFFFQTWPMFQKQDLCYTK